MGLWSVFLGQERAKKDDDLKPANSIIPITWPGLARLPPRKTLRRLGVVALALAVIYVFIANMPTNVPIRDHSHPSYVYPDDNANAPSKSYPHIPSDRLRVIPPAAADSLERPASANVLPGLGLGAEAGRGAGGSGTYNGPVRLPLLSQSLHVLSDTRGSTAKNKDVLFAAASLKSAAALLPLACQMGAELRSYVHFAVFGRSDVGLDELRDVNGVDDSCRILFHDARPDHAADSTDIRLETAADRAFYNINMYVHPQVLLVDGTHAEDPFFVRAVAAQAPAHHIPVVELPEGAAARMPWVAKLDSAALAAWSKVKIDILIHASPGASGGLIRLLKSLRAADFSPTVMPHLTIELPDRDASTAKFLESFHWPPVEAPSLGHTQQLSLRRRITRTNVNEEESSARFLESFWPSDTQHSHVLVLSPQAELSPQFMHYLIYSLLEYRYSNVALTRQWPRKLFGISLDLPSTFLHSSGPFRSPISPGASDAPGEGPASFLWQAPNSNAVLIPGQMWVELHGFVNRFLDIQRRKTGSSFLSEKRVSKRFPSWLELALRLCHARGYVTLYPDRPLAAHLATVHDELYQPPEEYARAGVKSEEQKQEQDGGQKYHPKSKPKQEKDDDLAGDPNEVTEVALGSGLLMDSLPGDGKLPTVDDMSVLLWDGSPAAGGLQELDGAAEEYTARFQREVDGCEALAKADLERRPSAGDLFCVSRKAE